LNGGVLKFGGIGKVIQKYQYTGFNAVTHRNIRYQLQQYELTGKANLNSEMITPATHVLLGTDAPLSDLSEPAESFV
jgi:hypothetical protein